MRSMVVYHRKRVLHKGHRRQRLNELGNQGFLDELSFGSVQTYPQDFVAAFNYPRLLVGALNLSEMPFALAQSQAACPRNPLSSSVTNVCIGPNILTHILLIPFKMSTSDFDEITVTADHRKHTSIRCRITMRPRSGSSREW